MLEADFRKMTSPNRVECPNCGGKFKVSSVKLWLLLDTFMNITDPT